MNVYDMAEIIVLVAAISVLLGAIVAHIATYGKQ